MAPLSQHQRGPRADVVRELDALDHDIIPDVVDADGRCAHCGWTARQIRNAGSPKCASARPGTLAGILYERPASGVRVSAPAPTPAARTEAIDGDQTRRWGIRDETLHAEPEPLVATIDTRRDENAMEAQRDMAASIRTMADTVQALQRDLAIARATDAEQLVEVVARERDALQARVRSLVEALTWDLRAVEREVRDEPPPGVSIDDRMTGDRRELEVARAWRAHRARILRTAADQDEVAGRSIARIGRSG